MTSLIKKVVDKIYVFLFPDAIGQFSATYRYKLLIVLLSMFMFSSAAFTFVFFQQ
ncbi:MAG: hypothetical protein ABR574_04320 [Cryomorphaceae bacterium]|nr:hypothetical protein [Flavobacteriales bacterium]